MLSMIRKKAAWMLFALSLLAAVSAGLARAQEDPAELAQARAIYQRDVEAAMRPLKDRYMQALEKVKKSLTFKGDLAGALKVQEEMETINSEIGLARLVGEWVCKFVNGAVHHYTIEADGTIFWTDPNPKKKLKTVLRGKDFLIEFPADDIVERLTASGGELQIEHFTPKSTYPGKPTTRGTGKRAPRKK